MPAALRVATWAWLVAGFVWLVKVATLVGFVFLEGLLKEIVPADGWFEGEVGIVATAIVALALGLLLWRRNPATLPTSAQQPT